MFLLDTAARSGLGLQARQSAGPMSGLERYSEYCNYIQHYRHVTGSIRGSNQGRYAALGKLIKEAGIRGE